MRRKDTRFFDAFASHANVTLKAARLVRSMFDDLGRAQEISATVSAAEKEGDEITHGVIRMIHETWITPIDRPDIHRLITRMDDVLDFAEAVAERIVLFEIRETRPDAKELADVLVKCCESIQKTMQLLPKMPRVELLECCGAIGALEDLADDVYRRAIATLFKAPDDPLIVLKWRDIYDALENATGRCADVANNIEGIVLEEA